MIIFFLEMQQREKATWLLGGGEKEEPDALDFSALQSLLKALRPRSSACTETFSFSFHLVYG